MALDNLYTDLILNICTYIDIYTVAAVRSLNKHLYAILENIFETTAICTKGRTNDFETTIMRNVFKYEFVHKIYMNISINVNEAMAFRVISINQILDFYVINCHINTDLKTYCIYARCSDLYAKYIIYYNNERHQEWLAKYEHAGMIRYICPPIRVFKTDTYRYIHDFIYASQAIYNANADDVIDYDNHITLCLLEVISGLPNEHLARALARPEFVRNVPIL